MTAATINPMPALYQRLNQIGLTRKYVRTVALPSWWDDEAALNPAGYAQVLLLLARHLGLDIHTLRDDSLPLRLRHFVDCKFKKADSVKIDDLAMCRSLAIRAAQLAAEGMTIPYQAPPADALEIRQSILDRGARWVGLEELLNYCWSLGIPVLHFSHLPKSARRPDGFATRINGRAVIVLCVQRKQPSWLSFILAHELGHIARNHLAKNEAILDDHIADPSSDAEEREANRFATELLTGSPTRQFRAMGRWPDAESLAREAKQIGQQQMIDPGHIVLNYAHSMGSANHSFYGVAKAALKRLSPHAHAITMIRSVMADQLDWSRLPDDSSEFLMRVTNAKIHS